MPDIRLSRIDSTTENPICCGAPGRTRTRNLLVRSQALCPIELRGPNLSIQ